jgi:hypothetical protein
VIWRARDGPVTLSLSIRPVNPKCIGQFLLVNGVTALVDGEGRFRVLIPEERVTSILSKISVGSINSVSFTPSIAYEELRIIKDKRLENIDMLVEQE